MTENYKVVLFNAPPEAGKDVAAKTCAKAFNMDHKEFKGKLYDILQVVYSLTDDQMSFLKQRDQKEVPSELLDGLSFRKALIKVSEDIIKPNFSKSYFGDSLAKSISCNTAVSDSGFVDELMSVVDKVGEDNVLVVRIHRDGCDFANDSRRYIPDGTVKNIVDIQNHMPMTGDNDKEFEEFKFDVCFWVGLWLVEDRLDANSN